MQWTEYIQQINRDEVDNQAIERYSFWRSQIIDMSGGMERRKMIYFCSLDPDILNEFCFYQPQYWDRLINWAKMFYSENDFSYEKKLQRAIMIMYGTDPDIIPDEDIPYLWRNGGVFEEIYKSAMKQWNDYSIPFENALFSVNRFSGAISILVNDGSGRMFTVTPVDFAYPPDLKAIFGEKPQDTEYLLLTEDNIDDESEWLPM